ncbi:MAG: type I DNA topoisomerase [Candidatus Acidiferrum sp.]
MARSLVIVESPAKAKTINKYLGRNFTVKASIGHVMDLPKKDIGIRLPGEDPSGRKKRKPKKGSKKGSKTEIIYTKKPIELDDAKIFEPTLQIISGKGKVINDLRKAASTADAVYLAGDPDREGEAISAHLAMVLSKPERYVEADASGRAVKDKPKENGKEPEPALDKNGKPKKKYKSKWESEPLQMDIPATDPKKIFRVTFNEITPKAIRAAFDKPRQVDENLVDAQQARRVLDRIVGYKISPLLWDKVRRGLSAGRVQTVALRLIVERELEIRAFLPVEYWSIHAMLDAGQPPLFEAKLFKRKGEDIAVQNQEAADAIVAAVSKAKWQVANVTQREKKRNAPPPFTTSKLQQAAYNRLRYTAKRTMGLAQRLYEGVELGEEGSVALITYMRTDSVHVSSDALAQVRELIPDRFGASYLPEKPNYYKSKKDAQEAHEAVRPTDVSRTPEDVRKYLEDDLFKLYQLIWQRFVASQMLPAIFDQTTIDISAADYTFRSSGSVQKFDGYLRVYQLPVASADREDDEKDDEGEGNALPRVTEGQVLRLDAIHPDQHFTEPPPRYTEATLVKDLEEKGIGRPSTYASIISTIVEREYVRKDQGRFTPTMLGERVSILLVKSFDDIFDVTFTARLEEELDEIEEGKLAWRDAVREFWEKFVVDLDKAGDDSGHGAGTCPRARRREQGRVLRQLRKRDGHQARPFRRIPRLHRLSRLQDHAPPGGRHAHRPPARRIARRKVHALQPAAGEKTRALRGIHRLFRLSQVQVYAAHHHGHQVPEMFRRRIRAPRQRRKGWPRPPAHFLRLFALSGLRFHHSVHADPGALPQMRRPIYRREKIQDRYRLHVPQGRLRLGEAGSRAGYRFGAAGRTRPRRG